MTKDAERSVWVDYRSGVERTLTNDRSHAARAFTRSPSTQKHRPRPIRGSGFMSGLSDRSFW
jgi:hypothetical protein